MRRTASILGIAALVLPLLAVVSVRANDTCVFDPVKNRLICDDSGIIPGDPGDGGVVPPGEWTGPRYVYVTTDAVVGECHYWSRIPGGLDSWDPGDDPAVIAANALPVCPGVVTPPVDVPGTAWSIFRSWDLDPPDIGLQPPDRGITGLPTFLASPVPTSIAHTETLPDGRVLQVRADVEVLRVDWGDGAWGSYDPRGALRYPTGIVTHTYRTKTCPVEYRETHPSGGLCHPTLEFYTIIALYRWVGEYNVGGGWIQIGTLDRTVSQPYDLDEVRGVPVPVP